MTNKMRLLSGLLLLPITPACDSPDDELLFREGEDPHPQPVPTIPCAEILRTDLRPASAQGAFRSVVVSSLQCEGTTQGLKLQIGRGSIARPIGEDHHVALAYPLPPGECYEIGGIAVDSLFDLYDATCMPDGDWSTFHVILTDGVGVVLDTVEMPFDLAAKTTPTKPLRKQQDGTWVLEGKTFGCSYAL